MEQCPTITLRKGATSVLQVDLTEFDMQGGSVVLTVSNRKGEPLKKWETSESRLWDVVIPDEFTATLKVGEDRYMYDIMWHIGEERFAQCEPSPVTVVLTAGGYQYGD